MAEVMILVVEDEAAISTLIQFTLEQAGFVVQCVASVEAAQPLLQSRLADVLLLDWMLPGTSGIDFIRQLRNDTRSRDLPIILLTARGEETDKEQGLNLGADDYITKPFSPRELVARINALLRRRAPQKTSTPLHVHDLELNPQQQRVQVNGQIIALGPSEFKLLHFFMTHPDRVYTRRQLLDLVWGDHVFIEERTVDVHIRRLRRGLETVSYDYLIQTVRGSGYRFACNQE
ncbi:phosphate regulon transcriptional regulator PhoB [Snodgrassella communis]|uniref:phosphate regulon transcriptional regulator PhoB n=1 Tax=Snodgrassella communis TaxID=2946699 RepID=UPI001EF72A78|nr:phosphate regulon transcriptional regulator PhoB [Snodgrassella communis]WMY91779.1 phosphate regulon transcriptional regulator PhoB [Snodgrassella communis]